jgi:hypothetical protein
MNCCALCKWQLWQSYTERERGLPVLWDRILTAANFLHPVLLSFWVVACSARGNLIRVAQQKLPNKYHVLPKKLFFASYFYFWGGCLHK